MAGEVRFEVVAPRARGTGGPLVGAVRDLHEDPAGVIWAATSAGLCRFQRDGGALACQPLEVAAETRPPVRSVWSLAVDPAGSLWVGTEEGLARARPDGAFDLFEPDPLLGGALREGFVNALAVDRSGGLWVGTDAGLARLDTAAKPFRHFFRGRAVWALLRDDAGTLWVGTDDGLYGGREGESSFVRFADDPARPGEWPQGPVWSLATGPGGVLWVGTAAHGLCRLEPGTGRRRWYRSTPADPTSLTNNAVLSLLVDSSGAQRDATYTNLDPGRYVLRVRAASCDGVWNEQGLSLRLVVTPPVWRTWWFRALLAVLVVAGVVGGHRLRVRSLERRRRDLEALVDSRTRDLAAKTALLERTDGIVREVNSQLGLDGLLETILDQTRAIPLTDVVSFLVRNHATHGFRVRAAWAQCCSKAGGTTGRRPSARESPSRWSRPRSRPSSRTRSG